MNLGVVQHFHHFHEHTWPTAYAGREREGPPYAFKQFRVWYIAILRKNLKININF